MIPKCKLGLCQGPSTWCLCGSRAKRPVVAVISRKLEAEALTARMMKKALLYGIMTTARLALAVALGRCRPPC